MAAMNEEKRKWLTPSEVKEMSTTELEEARVRVETDLARVKSQLLDAKGAAADAVARSEQAARDADQTVTTRDDLGDGGFAATDEGGLN